MATVAPPSLAQVLVQKLVRRKLKEWGTPDMNLLGATMPERMSDPIPVYSVDLSALDGAGDEFPVRHSGWRTFLVSVDGRVRAADVKGAGGDFHFSRLVQGPGLDALVASAFSAEDQAANVRNQDIRLIESDPLKVSALWIHGVGGFVRPFRGAEIRDYTEAEFRAVLVQRLREVKAQYSV